MPRSSGLRNYIKEETLAIHRDRGTNGNEGTLGSDTLKWNGDRFRKWAERIGSSTYQVVDAILTSKRVEQQSYRSCMGLLKLADKYSVNRLEAACRKALSFTATPSYKSIKNILDTGSDQSEMSDRGMSTDSPTDSGKSSHALTRGADYYRR